MAGGLSNSSPGGSVSCDSELSPAPPQLGTICKVIVFESDLSWMFILKRGAPKEAVAGYRFFSVGIFQPSSGTEDVVVFSTG